MTARIETAIKLIESLTQQIKELQETVNEQKILIERIERIESLVDEIDNRI